MKVSILRVFNIAVILSFFVNFVIVTDHFWGMIYERYFKWGLACGHETTMLSLLEITTFIFLPFIPAWISLFLLPRKYASVSDLDGSVTFYKVFSVLSAFFTAFIYAVITRL